MPGPKPISRTRSVRATSSSETAQAFRLRLDERCAITQPAMRPPTPLGRWNWLTTRRTMRRLRPAVRERWWWFILGCAWASWHAVNKLK